MWILGDVKFGEHSIKLSGSGSYIEKSIVTAPASPAAGKVRVYATSGTSLRMKDSTGTETDLAAAGSGGDLYNFLTNPGFEIWQRGAGAFTANGVYCADRWTLRINGSDTLSVSRDGVNIDSGSFYSAACTFTKSGGTLSGIGQIFRYDATEMHATGLRGRTVVFAIRVKTSTASTVRAYIDPLNNDVRTYSSYHTGGGGWETLSVSVTLDSTASTVGFGVQFDVSATIYLDNATLVIGSTAQTYYPLHPAEEWERCQRYYEWLPAADGGPGNFSLMYEMYADAARNVYWTQMFLTRKAVVPTVTKVGTWTVANAGQPGLSGAAASRTAFTFLLAASGVGFARAYGDSTDDGWTVEANP